MSKAASSARPSAPSPPAVGALARHLEAFQRDPELDPAAQLPEALGQDRLGLVLGQGEHEVVGQRLPVEADAGDRPLIVVDHQLAHVNAGGEQALGDARGLEQGEAAGVDADGARQRQGIGLLVDHPGHDAAARQLHRCRQARRAGADNEEGGHGDAAPTHALPAVARWRAAWAALRIRTGESKPSRA
jgi:hypothetical protein